MERPNVTHIRQLLASRMHGDGVKHVRDFKCLEEIPFDNISMGTRPSGTLHTGNLFVIATCLHYLRINSKATVNIDIMDLDFDNQRGPVFTPYHSLLSTKNFITQLAMAVEMMAEVLKVDPNSVKIRYFSDRMREPELRKTILGLAKDKEATKCVKYSMSDKPGRYYNPPLSLICSTCSQSSSDFARYTSQDDIFTSVCRNATCPTQGFASDLSRDMFNVHYLVDPVRDLLLPSPTLHIFGGDYGLPTGAAKKAKFLRVAAVMEAARCFLDIKAELPSFFITPMLLDQDGRKVSKSLGNGGYNGSDISTYLREEIDKVVKIMKLCIDGTLSGMTLLGPRVADNAG